VRKLYFFFNKIIKLIKLSNHILGLSDNDNITDIVSLLKIY
jgi:hypothetical protein